MLKQSKLALALSTILVSGAAVAHTHHDAPRLHGVESSVAVDDKKAPTAQHENNTTQYSAFALACNLSNFTSSNAQQVINAIEANGTSCVNELFNATSDVQAQVFTSQKMYEVAKHTAIKAKDYSGQGDSQLESLFIFLRAGYYAEFYNDSVSIANWVQPEVKKALQAFVDNRNFFNNNVYHAPILKEALTTIDSANLHGDFLPAITKWIEKFDNNVANSNEMRDAVAYVFTILYRGQWNNDFIAKVKNAHDLVSALNAFVLRDYLLTNNAWLLNDGARELARLKDYKGYIESAVDAGLKKIFSRYSMTGFGSSVWITAAGAVSYYEDCSVYNICGWEGQMEDAILSQHHECSSSIKIRAQDLTQNQLTGACNVMTYEEDLFHKIANTNYQPVANDYNDQLVVNIFDSYSEYSSYAGIIFNGMPTNNGGMYLEGTPSDPNNVPNFVAHEADYANAPHYVWNLAHEYVHYLDARFNLYGDFSAPTEKTVWWTEGFAEYVSKEDNHSRALQELATGTRYPLSEILENDYQSGQERIYYWGYFAVRFMFERHQDEVDLMLESTRSGNWSAYKARVNTWKSYDGEFAAWIEKVAQGYNEGRPDRPKPDVNKSPVAEVNGPYSAYEGDLISFSSNGSYDSDGYIQSVRWDFGDGQSSSQENPQHAYTSAGTYTVTLTVKDEDGATSAKSATVTVEANSNGGGGTTPGVDTLNNGESININGQTGAELIFRLDVPAGASELEIVMQGGSGDADLYVKKGGYATASDYDCRPYRSGNNETCKFDQVSEGTYYVTAYGYSEFMTSLTASFNVSSGGGQPNLPNACATQGAISSGRALQNGVVECVTVYGDTYLAIPEVSSHQSVAITTANGTGDINISYSNTGWPNDYNTLQHSFNQGNNECIRVTNQANYWGYVKISGEAQGAAIVVDFDTPSCR